MKNGPWMSTKNKIYFMTEREIIEKQEQTGNREYYLMLVGSFLHAYGNETQGDSPSVRKMYEGGCK